MEIVNLVLPTMYLKSCYGNATCTTQQNREHSLRNDRSLMFCQRPLHCSVSFCISLQRAGERCWQRREI
jgi:hypothetical protein